MADNIEYNKARGTDSFVSRREVPWHKKGQIVDNYLTTAEAIIACNADYEVGLAPNYPMLNQLTLEGARLSNNVLKVIEKGVSNYYNTKQNPTSFSTYRKDTNDIFGTVGSRYEVVQNIEAFEFIDNIIQTGEAVIETAGVLGKGERIFVVAKLPDYIELSNGDKIESYLFITMAHDGTGMITAALTKIRIVCNNTLNMALSQCSNKVQFKHTRNVRDKLDAGAKLMGLNNKYSKELEEALRFMKNTILSETIVVDTVFDLFLSPTEKLLVDTAKGNLSKVSEISTKKKNIIYDVLTSVNDGPGQNLYRGTGLWLYNGVTTYLSNTKNYKDNDDRLLSLAFGAESKVSQKAFDLITAL